ncbi:MAG: hypothetical protein ABR981_00630 [Candidatus Micrarchaeaceae archaeon]|jgi:hypothetical protein
MSGAEITAGTKIRSKEELLALHRNAYQQLKAIKMISDARTVYLDDLLAEFKRLVQLKRK